MSAGARLSVTELRHSVRHPLEHHMMAEQKQRGEVPIDLANISSYGFMIANADGFTRGCRVVLQLPVVGRIEAHCIWTSRNRAGFQFERILRADDFEELLSRLQPNAALRRRG